MIVKVIGEKKCKNWPYVNYTIFKLKNSNLSTPRTLSTLISARLYVAMELYHNGRPLHNCSFLRRHLVGKNSGSVAKCRLFSQAT